MRIYLIGLRMVVSVRDSDNFFTSEHTLLDIQRVPRRVLGLCSSWLAELAVKKLFL